MSVSAMRVFGQRQMAPVIVKPPIELVENKTSKRKTEDDLKAIAADQRKYRRIKVRLSGRFMREDEEEFLCYTNDISAGGMNITSPVKCERGEYVIFYIEEIGRIEGHVVRNHDEGFAVAIDASAHKREKIVASLTWILNRHELSHVEARRHERQIPSRPLTTLQREDGTQMQARVLDLSLGGARIDVKVSLNSGEKVMLGKSSGYVVRVDEHGTAIQFDTEQNSQSLSPFFS